MRKLLIAQSTVKYESEVKQTLAHIQLYGI